MLLSKSRPSGPFNEMSMIRKSGRVAVIACNAPAASSASPQIMRSGSRFIISDSPSRTMGWSSTMKILFFC